MAKVIITQPKEVLAAFAASRGAGQFFADYNAIGLVENNEILASVIYANYTRETICMHVAAVEGRRWLTRGYLFACFDYPFNQLGVRTVVGLVPKKNKQARTFDENLGFRMTGCIPDGMPKDDLLVYTMTRKQCRWLTLRKAA